METYTIDIYSVFYVHAIRCWHKVEAVIIYEGCECNSPWIAGILGYMYGLGSDRDRSVQKSIYIVSLRYGKLQICPLCKPWPCQVKEVI